MGILGEEKAGQGMDLSGTNVKPRVGRVVSLLVGACIAMTFGVVPLGSTAKADDATTAALAVVSASSSLSTPVAVNGVFKDASGSPISGANVLLMAWPLSSDSAGVGTVGYLKPLGRTITDSAGNYQLRVDPSVNLVGFVAPDGYLNVEVLAATSTGMTETESSIPASAASPGSASATATTEPEGSSEATELATVSTSVPTCTPSTCSTPLDDPSGGLVGGLTQTGGVVPATVNLGGGVTQIVDTSGVGSDGLSTPNVSGWCSYKPLKNFGNKWQTVGQTYSSTTGVTEQFTYKKASSSSTGTAVTIDTADLATATSDTAIDRSSSSTIIFPKQGDHTWVYDESQWDWKQIKVYDCLYARGHWNTVVKATTFEGGAKVVNAGAPSATHCDPYLPNSTLVKDTTKAITWTNGVHLSLPRAPTIDFSSRTGYSTEASLTYHVKASAPTRQLCGMGGAAARSAWIVDAQD